MWPELPLPQDDFEAAILSDFDCHQTTWDFTHNDTAREDIATDRPVATYTYFLSKNPRHYPLCKVETRLQPKP